MERVWVKHPQTGAVKNVAASAVPVMDTAGWKALTKSELAAREKEQLAARRKRLDALTASQAPAPEPGTTRAPASPSRSAAAGRQDTENTQEN